MHVKALWRMDEFVHHHSSGKAMMQWNSAHAGKAFWLADTRGFVNAHAARPNACTIGCTCWYL